MEVEEEWNRESTKVAQEKERAVEIRKIATERIGQTKKRHVVHHESDDDGEFSETEETPCKKKKVDFAQLFSDSLKMKSDQFCISIEMYRNACNICN